MNYGIDNLIAYFYYLFAYQFLELRVDNKLDNVELLCTLPINYSGQVKISTRL